MPKQAGSPAPTEERDPAYQEERLAATTAANEAALEEEVVGEETVAEGRSGSTIAAGRLTSDEEGVAAAAASLEELMVATEEERTAPMEVEEDAAVAPNVVVAPAREATEPEQVTQTVSRPPRAAAVKAVALIADHSAEDRRKARAPRKRRVAASYGSDELPEQQEADDPVDEVCEVRCVTEREDRGGVRWYRVRWKEVAEGKDEYSWVPEEGLVGALVWKNIVDRYYDEELPANPDLLFRHYLDQDMGVITMGDSNESTCVYFAVDKIMELQQASMCLTEGMVMDFEAKEGFDRLAQRG